MGLPNSKKSLDGTASPLLSHKERLFRILQALGPRTVVLPSSLDEPLSRAIDQLECILADHLDPEYQREGAACVSLRVVEPESSPSGLQPVQEILDCIPDSHIVTSSDGIIQMANQQAAQLFQRSQHQLTGLSLSTLVDDNHWVDLLKRLQTLNGDIQNWQGEIQITPDSQSPRSVICTLSALRDTGGRLVGAHWLLWDVTEHRHGIMAQEFSHEISQLLLSGVTVEQALTILCRRLVETFGYPLIWVGMKEVGGTVRILAQSGDHALTGNQRGERWDECEKLSGAVSPSYSGQGHANSSV